MTPELRSAAGGGILRLNMAAGTGDLAFKLR